MVITRTALSPAPCTLSQQGLFSTLVEQGNGIPGFWIREEGSAEPHGQSSWPLYSRPAWGDIPAFESWLSCKLDQKSLTERLCVFDRQVRKWWAGQDSNLGRA